MAGEWQLVVRRENPDVEAAIARGVGGDELLALARNRVGRPVATPLSRGPLQLLAAAEVCWAIEQWV